VDEVSLIGLDFGTTTSSAVFARAKLLHNRVSGRVELSDMRESFRSPMHFTPLIGDQLDEAAAAALLDDWLVQSGVERDRLFGGGALLTGLTAQKENAAALVTLIRERIGAAIIARADDPRMESWLAFMGNSAKLSRRLPDTPIINLDIGGGTTNLALGLNGAVLTTGCLFVGARHFQVEPGSYRIVKLSNYAKAILQHLGIAKFLADELSPDDVRRILDLYEGWLVDATAGHSSALASPLARLHQQIPFDIRNRTGKQAVITLSGGVGELVYAALNGRQIPGKTAYGDLGIDLALRLANLASWKRDFRQFAPEGGGRATSFGLLRYSTQVSGSTLYLSDAGILPLRDVPIFGAIDQSLPEPQWQTTLQLLRHSANGACFRILLHDIRAEAVRTLGRRIGAELRAAGVPRSQPIVILIVGNVGKTLGHYITEWGSRPQALVVVDEIAAPDAQFVHIGRLHDRVVPVSFYGLQE
jgi:ethanolamine utilization protein EutA